MTPAKQAARYKVVAFFFAGRGMSLVPDDRSRIEEHNLAVLALQHGLVDSALEPLRP